MYTIKTAALIGYVDDMISEKEILSWDNAIGVYVIGRPDPDLQQPQNVVVAEGRTYQMRTIYVEEVTLQSEPVASGEATYWMTPVKSGEQRIAEDIIHDLVGQECVYAIGDRTPGRKRLKPGDWICFYACGKGVVGHAKVMSYPKREPNPRARDPESFPWTFRLGSVNLYLDAPIVINAALRSRLDGFEGRDPNKSWGWFVQATRSVTEQDFRVLTGQETQV